MLRVFFLQLLIILTLVSCGNREPVEEAYEDPGISWWCSNRAASFNLDMEDLPVILELQRRTGISIDFVHPPVSQYTLRFKLMLASGRYPDIISHDFINDYPGGVAGAVHDGIIIAIDDELMRHAPNLDRFLTGHPEIADTLRLPDGRYFCVPSLITDKTSSTYIGPFIRKDLLDKHDLDIPQTIADWENVLDVFYQDPDIDFPLTFYGGNFMDTHFLIGSYGTDWGFYLKNDNVVFGPSEKEFIDFLTTFRRWYETGWVDPGCLINSKKAYTGTVDSNTVGIYIDYITNIYNYTQKLASEDSSVELMPLAYPSFDDNSPIPAGHNAGVFIPFASAYISTDAGHPEEVIGMLDYAWSEEGRILFNFGIEGESYTLRNGKPYFLDSIFRPEGDGLKYYIVSGPYLRDPESFLQSLRLEAQVDAVRLWSSGTDFPRQLPVLIAGRDESIKLMEIISAMDSYIKDTSMDFILGKTDVNMLENIEDNLKDMGLKTAEKIYNALYKNSTSPDL